MKGKQIEFDFNADKGVIWYKLRDGTLIKAKDYHSELYYHSIRLGTVCSEIECIIHKKGS